MADEDQGSNKGCGCFGTGILIILVFTVIGYFVGESVDIEDPDDVYQFLQNHRFECAENVFGDGPQVSSFLLFTSKQRCEMYTYVNGEKRSYESYSYDLGDVSGNKVEIEIASGNSYEFELEASGDLYMEDDRGEIFLFSPEEK